MRSARHPIDRAEHGRELAHRDLPVRERLDHHVKRLLRVVGAGDARQLEGKRPAVPTRLRPFRAYPHRGRVTAAGEVDDPVDRLLRPLGERFLPGDGLLVTRAERTARWIAALSGLEFHGFLREIIPLRAPPLYFRYYFTALRPVHLAPAPPERKILSSIPQYRV
jgi:hypothetical protein